jgi:alpha-1,6-mannosyltransferase
MSAPQAKAGAPVVVTSPWPVPAALAALVLALAAFLAWQYFMPAAFESSFLLNHAGVDHFRETFGPPRPDVPLATYTAVFRALLGAVWAAYFVAVLAGALGAPLPRGRALAGFVVAVALAAAVLWPPSFSCDVYGYVGYGRMQVVYGWNPYLTSQKALKEVGDPVGRFLVWGIGSPYGPLWTALSTAIVWVVHGAGLRGASLLAQVMVFKLVGAGAVVAAALVGRRVAERLAPGRGDLTLMAIGANPLFVIEGAGNAHNDLVMMALVVAALGAALEGRARRAALYAGLAGAIKFLPLLLVPWLVLGTLRARERPWAARMRTALAEIALAALPAALAFIPYWAGARTFGGLAQRWNSSQTTSASASAALWAQGGLLLLAYGGATAYVARGGRERMLFGWIVVAAAIYLVAAGIWLPWYGSWVWIVALLAWDRRSMTCSYLAFCFAVVLTIRYSVAHVGPAGP